MKQLSIGELRVRHWHARTNYTPYRGVTHGLESDEQVDWHEKVREFLSDLPEGSVISMTVSAKTPPDDIPEPDPNDIWELTGPHHYERRKT